LQILHRFTISVCRTGESCATVGRIRYDLALTFIGNAEVDRAVADVLDYRTAAPAIRGLLVGRGQLKCSRVAEYPIRSSLVKRLQSSIMAWPETFHAGISCMNLLKQLLQSIPS